MLNYLKNRILILFFKRVNNFKISVRNRLLCIKYALEIYHITHTSTNKATRSRKTKKGKSNRLIIFKIIQFFLFSLGTLYNCSCYSTQNKLNKYNLI